MKNKQNKFKHRIILALCGLGFVAIESCAPKPLPIIPDSIASDNPEAEQAFREARQLFENGNLDEADKKLQLFIRQYPDDPLRRYSELFRGRIALEKGDPVGARLLLEPIMKGRDSVSERAAFYDGIALFRIGEHEKSVNRLSGFIGRLTEREEKLLLLGTIWRAAKRTNRIPDAIIWLDKYLMLLPPEQRDEKMLTELEYLSQMVGNVEVLEKMREKLSPAGPAWPLVVARIARIYLAQGEVPKANETLAEATKENRQNEESIQEIVTIIENRNEIELGRVGVIAPISGRARLIGDTVIKGTMLAAKTMRAAANMEITVAIRDSKSNPKLAARAVDELVKNEHVSAIIGPLSGKCAAAAGERAEKLGVPLITLTVREDLPSDRPFVFRYFTSNRMEISELVTTAAGEGVRRFAVFRPNNGYGKTMETLFEQAVVDQGLQFAGAISYPPGAKNFTDAMARLKDLGNIQALFVPDSASRLALVAPALAAAGMWSAPAGTDPQGPGQAIQLLVPSTGYSQDLIRRAARYLEGALFTVFFHPEGSEGAAEFSERYRGEYGQLPNYISGFSHDAVVLIANAIRNGANDRDAIRRWLTQDFSQAGEGSYLATPFSGFSVEGEPLAKPRLLQILDRQFQVLK